MKVLTVTPELEAMLAQLNDETELWDADGNFIGTFTPRDQAEAELYDRARELFDLEEADRRLKEEKGGFLFDEIKAAFKMMEADEREKRGEGPSMNPRPPLQLFRVEQVTRGERGVEIAGKANRVHLAYLPIKTGSPITLRKLDGTFIETAIRGWDLSLFSTNTGITLSSEVSEADVPIGTEIWLMKNHE
jgi:hypothetical protein